MNINMGLNEKRRGTKCFIQIGGNTFGAICLTCWVIFPSRCSDTFLLRNVWNDVTEWPRLANLKLQTSDRSCFIVYQFSVTLSRFLFGWIGKGWDLDPGGASSNVDKDTNYLYSCHLELLQLFQAHFRILYKTEHCNFYNLHSVVRWIRSGGLRR
jgi:hypothetical protein